MQNEDLQKEWQKYLEQTTHHVEVVRTLCEKLGMDPERETPGRQVVRTIGKALVKAMQLALDTGDARAAEITAAECVVLAESKDHANWHLIGKLAEDASGKAAEAFQAAADEVEDEEDEHLYHRPRLGPRVVVRGARDARGAAPARRGEEREDRDGRRPRRAVRQPPAERPARPPCGPVDMDSRGEDPTARRRG